MRKNELNNEPQSVDSRVTLHSSFVNDFVSKRIPHCARVRFGDVPKPPKNFCVGHIYNSTQVESRYDETLDRIVRVKVKKRIDIVKELSDYRMSDFYLENQIDSGSIKNLVPVSMTGDVSIVESSVSSVLDALDRSVSDLDSSDNNNDSINNNYN